MKAPPSGQKLYQAGMIDLQRPSGRKRIIVMTAPI
jgi:hypothetical protein